MSSPSLTRSRITISSELIRYNKNIHVISNIKSFHITASRLGLCAASSRRHGNNVCLCYSKENYEEHLDFFDTNKHRRRHVQTVSYDDVDADGGMNGWGAGDMAKTTFEQVIETLVGLYQTTTMVK